MGERHTDGPGGVPRANQRLTVAQAAVSLGIAEGAVRSRIKRGTLPTVKEAGRVYVVWSGGTAAANYPPHPGEPFGEPRDQSELVDSLREQVAYLQRQLDAEREAGRRKDHLLAAALERIPAAIEAPSKPRDSPTEAAEVPEGSEPRPAAEDAQEAPEPRSWWRRWFGFE